MSVSSTAESHRSTPISALKHSDHDENHHVHFPDQDRDHDRSLAVVVGDPNGEIIVISEHDDSRPRHRRMESPPPLDNGRSTSPSPSHGSRNSSLADGLDNEGSKNFFPEDYSDMDAANRLPSDESHTCKKVSFNNKFVPIIISEDDKYGDADNDGSKDIAVSSGELQA